MNDNNYSDDYESDLPAAYLHGEVDYEALSMDEEIEEIAIRNDAKENGYELDDASPIAWLNSASIVVDREHDEVSLLISVGDPRGALAMSVRKGSDGKLILHVPHAEDSMAHVDMSEIAPGTYKLAA